MKSIAAVTARADDGEQKSLLSGMAQRCLELGVDFFVYSNIFNHWVRDEVLNYENVIYDFFNPSAFDAVIVTAEAFFDQALLETILDRIRKSGVPAVVIGGEAAGFVCIDSRDEEDFAQIAEHLIQVHGFTDLDILTGFKGDPHAEKRLSGCRSAFRKAGIPFRKHKVHYGNFWNDSGAELARKYCSGELPMPQALICANDHMAFGFCDELVARGVEIPGQITVTGYEYTESRMLHYPLLTTFRRGRHELGVEAVNRVLGKASEPLVSGNLVPGNTCTCGAEPRQLGEEIKTARTSRYHQIESTLARFGSALTACRSLSEYTAVLRDHMYLLHGASRLYLCVSKEWSKQTTSSGTWLCCDVHSDLPVEFNKTALPPLVWGNKDRAMGAMVYCFSPLVFETRCFGFTVLGYPTPQTCDSGFRDWSKTAANALEFLRMKNDIQYLEQCQSVSALHDALTGFYREEEFRAMVGSGKDNLCIALVSLFFTERKFIRGENHKNDLIPDLARAIKKCCRKQEPCGRIGEDAFAVLHDGSPDMFMDALEVFVSRAVFTKSGDRTVRVSFTDLASTEMQHLTDISEECIRTAEKEHLRQIRLPHGKGLSDLHHLVRASPKSAPDIQEACRRLAVGEGRFRVLYKECFGLSYMQDCIEGRIALAKYLLCTSAMSIYAVSLECGYADEKLFSRQFRNAVHCSPVQYRRAFMS